MIDLNKIYQMDCFDGFDLIDDSSIDLVLTDPPYNVKLKDSIKLVGRKKAVYRDFKQMDWDKTDMRKMYDELFPHFDRIVKENGSVIMFCKVDYISYVIDSAKKNNFDSKASIIWHKPNPVIQVRKRNYLSSIEGIVWVARWHEDKCLFKFNFTTQNDMHNFIECPICQAPERTEHPTQKPLKIIRKLVKTHTDVDDTVLDPFIGSGTTAVACKMTGRNFIGFELDKKYVDISNNRLKNVNLEEQYVKTDIQDSSEWL